MSGQSQSSSSSSHSDQTYAGADTSAPTSNGAGTTSVVRSAPHGHALTACLIVVNVAVVALIYLYFWRFFFRKRSVGGEDDDEDASSSAASTPVARSPLRSQRDAHDRLMASLPTFVVRAGAGEKRGPAAAEECAVCIAELRDGDEARALPRCGHRFHAACVDAWLRRHTTCPLCRASVVVAAGTAAGPKGGGGVTDTTAPAADDMDARV